MASSYSPEEAVSLSIDLKREDGTDISADVLSIEYAVFDHNDVEKVVLQTLGGFTPGDLAAVVTVPANLNALDSGTTRGMRVIRLRCTTSNGVVEIVGEYLIEKVDTLQVMKNSVQTYQAAQLVALDMSDIPGWESANKHRRSKALVDAYEHLCQMNFDLEKAVVFADFPGVEKLDIVRLRNTDAAAWSALPTAFKEALAKAQVVEADFVLRGQDTAEGLARAGFMSRTIGESSMMLRAGTHIHYPVCKRAVGYLSRFMPKQAVIGRG